MAENSIFSVSISGRVTVDMHSLNNEGGEGNQVQTRMVTIVHRTKDRPEGEDGYALARVNAISGDMFKHIQAEHFYQIARANHDLLPLCGGCRVFSASRALDDQSFMGELRGRNDQQVIDALLQRCALDDVAGNLIAPQRRAERGRSVPRKSVVEFGWVVGLPEITRTDSYFHVRYAAERGGADVEQPIFHRPASSGRYAAVAHLEVSRIGFNDISQTYALSDDERQARYTAVLKSILYTFVQPNGAMRGTQNPHVLGFEGIVTRSTRPLPAPALSPLEETYREDIKRVATALNGVEANAVSFDEFDSMGKFAEIMQQLINESQPYRLTAA